MITRILIPLLLVGAVALACGSRTHADATVKPTAKRVRLTGTPTLSAQTLTVQRLAPAPEHVIVATLKSVFVVRADARAINFALDLTNTTKKNVELSFPSGQEYDFAVVDVAGREVYRWSKERMFTQSIKNRLLDGGATMRIEERAEQSLPNGSYVAVATLRSSNYPVQERVPFELR